MNPNTKNPLRASLPASLLLAGMFLAPGAQAQNFARGQELFEHHCQACHHDFHAPGSRHLQSLDELGKRIESWATHTNTNWQKNELQDVLYYLNKAFYKFPAGAL